MLCVGETVLYNPIIQLLSRILLQRHHSIDVNTWQIQPLEFHFPGVRKGRAGAGVFAECLHYYHHCHPPLPLAPSLMWYHCTVSGYTIITTTPCIYTLDTLYILGADADFMDRIINTTISNHSDQECVKWHPASRAPGIDYLHCWPRDTLSIVRKTLYCIICVKTTIPLV